MWRTTRPRHVSEAASRTRFSMAMWLATHMAALSVAPDAESNQGRATLRLRSTMPPPGSAGRRSARQSARCRRGGKGRDVICPCPLARLAEVARVRVAPSLRVTGGRACEVQLGAGEVAKRASQPQPQPSLVWLWAKADHVAKESSAPEDLASRHARRMPAARAALPSACKPSAASCAGVLLPSLHARSRRRCALADEGVVLRLAPRRRCQAVWAARRRSGAGRSFPRMRSHQGLALSLDLAEARAAPRAAARARHGYGAQPQGW